MIGELWLIGFRLSIVSNVAMFVSGTIAATVEGKQALL